MPGASELLPADEQEARTIQKHLSAPDRFKRFMLRNKRSVLEATPLDVTSAPVTVELEQQELQNGKWSAEEVRCLRYPSLRFSWTDCGNNRGMRLSNRNRCVPAPCESPRGTVNVHSPKGPRGVCAGLLRAGVL